METLSPESSAASEGAIRLKALHATYQEICRSANIPDDEELAGKLTVEGAVTQHVEARDIGPAPAERLSLELERTVNELFGAFEDMHADLSSRPKRIRIALFRQDYRPLPVILVEP